MIAPTGHSPAPLSPESLRSFSPYLSPYIPHIPTPKQYAFLMLSCREAFYGGAAGGGKSDALLMGALQYVEVPGYSALILRKTFQELRKSGNLIDRAHQWLYEFAQNGMAKWDGAEHTWRFAPGEKWAKLGYTRGGTLAFGYLDSEQDKYRYQGANYHYVAFDEVSQFWDWDYLYLFSRLRKSRCPIPAHREKPEVENCPTCREFWPSSSIPLRLRAASNPPAAGHPGRLWLKERFVIKQDRTGPELIYRGHHPTRAYIPAFVKDNPALDEAEYAESLSHLDPVTREQLLRGDWGVSADGRFRKSWVRYYSINGPYVCLTPDRKTPIYRIEDCRCLTFIDPAASAKEGPGDKDIWKREPSWTVIGTFLLTPRYDLIWWDLVRFQKEIPDLFTEVKRVYAAHQPEYISIEANGLGIGVYQSLQRMGLPVRDLKPRSLDKLVRATDAANRMEKGQIYFPTPGNSDGKAEQWLDALEAEVFTWTGHKEETADQIDVLAYAALEVSRIAGASESEFPADAMPAAYDMPTPTWGKKNNPFF